MLHNTSSQRSGYVWIVAGVGLLIYASIGLLGQQIPGVENLVGWINSLSGNWIMLAALAAIMIEGLYFIGSFFPGSTIIIVVTILSQTQSWVLFMGTITAIFIGWVVAGIINILLAHKLRALKELSGEAEVPVNDRFWTTWYPAFRANQEVAQIAAGAKPLQVFFSSLRVKVMASALAAVSLAIIPLFIDISEVSNEEGFTSVLVVGVISLVVGTKMVYSSRSY